MYTMLSLKGWFVLANQDCWSFGPKILSYGYAIGTGCIKSWRLHK